MGVLLPLPQTMALPLLSGSSGASDVVGLARAIQLSLAPVFLLSAITGLLGVISTRLSRVIDRAQELQIQGTERTELAPLRRRMTLLTLAIDTVSITGILVAVTFISAVTVIDLVTIVVPLFVLAMLTLTAALLLLLLDSRLASRQIHRRF